MYAHLSAPVCSALLKAMSTAMLKAFLTAEPKAILQATLTPMLKAMLKLWWGNPRANLDSEARASEGNSNRDSNIEQQ